MRSSYAVMCMKNNKEAKMGKDMRQTTGPSVTIRNSKYACMGQQHLQIQLLTSLQSSLARLVRVHSYLGCASVAKHERTILCFLLTFYLLFIPQPPISTRPDTLIPFTTLFRSALGDAPDPQATLPRFDELVSVLPSAVGFFHLLAAQP